MNFQLIRNFLESLFLFLLFFVFSFLTLQAKSECDLINKNGSLYCLINGKTVTDKEIDGRIFGADGKYTTENQDLDQFLRQITKDCTTDSMSQIEKFRAVYDWVIENCHYRAIQYLLPKQGWEIPEALSLFQKLNGNCVSYAAGITMLARNLGFEARGIYGDVHQTVQWVNHAWTEVDYKGKTYLCDAEIEGVFAPGKGFKWDLFMKPYGSTPTKYRVNGTILE